MVTKTSRSINRVVITVMATLFLVGCSTPEKRIDSKPIAAIINSDTVFQEAIDSLMAGALYTIRQEGLRKIILQRWINAGNAIPDSLNNKKQVDVFMRKLKDEGKLKTYLFLPEERKFGIDELYSHSRGPINSPHTLSIIFDYECGHCITHLKEINQNPVFDSIRINYIFFSNAVNLTAMACEAADKQGKYFEYLSAYLSKTDVWTDQTMMECARQLNLDLRKFNNDLNNAEIARQLNSNIEHLPKREIYSIPRFILDEKLQHAESTLDEIADKIRL